MGLLGQGGHPVGVGRTFERDLVDRRGGPDVDVAGGQDAAFVTGAVVGQATSARI